MGDSQVRRRVRVSEGVYRDQWGYAAKVEADGQVREKRYPKNTDIKTMQRWRNETRVALQQSSQKADKGTLAADVETYLGTIQNMPTLEERTAHLALWVAVFGHKQRASITPVEIETQLAAWLAEGLAASTVAHRRSALMRLWNVLDGKEGAPAERNPVRATTRPKEPEPEARALNYRTIEKILKAMPNTGRRVKGQPVAPGSKTVARLRVLAYTGMGQASIKRMQPKDIDWAAGTLTIRPRHKGKGTKTRVVPLTPQGLEALRQFAALDCWGSFSTSAMYHSFQRACDGLGLVDVRPYDLRHSFGTMVYQTSGDIRAAQLMLAHASSTTTQRYTQGAETARLRAVTTQLGKALPKVPVAVPRGSTTTKRQNRKKTA